MCLHCPLVIYRPKHLNTKCTKSFARYSCSIFSRSELIWQYWRICCFGKGWGNTETPSKLFSNHNALGQLTNHNTFRFSEGGPSSNTELIESFVSGWGERYCNNVKNNAIFEPPSMRACSSTPPKQNQDFVKEHNRTPLPRPFLFSYYNLKWKWTWLI